MDMEYYVKWRDRAHIHCSWVPGPRMEAAAARSGGRGVRPKLQLFERAQVHGEVRVADRQMFVLCVKLHRLRTSPVQVLVE